MSRNRDKFYSTKWILGSGIIAWITGLYTAFSAVVASHETSSFGTLAGVAIATFIILIIGVAIMAALEDYNWEHRY